MRAAAAGKLACSAVSLLVPQNTTLPTPTSSLNGGAALPADPDVAVAPDLHLLWRLVGRPVLHGQRRRVHLQRFSRARTCERRGRRERASLPQKCPLSLTHKAARCPTPAPRLAPSWRCSCSSCSSTRRACCSVCVACCVCAECVCWRLAAGDAAAAAKTQRGTLQSTTPYP